MTGGSVERRTAARRRALLAARVVFNENQSTLDCLVRDIGADGARLRFAAAPVVPPTFELKIDSRGETRHARRIWVKGSDVGVRFD